MKKTLISLLLAVASLFSYGQQKAVRKHIVSFEKIDRNFLKGRSDTSNYTIMFENGFENDTVTVYLDGKIMMAERLITGDINGLAKKIVIPKTDDFFEIKIRVNQSAYLDIPVLKNMNYILINYNSYTDLIVTYSRYLPMYN